MTIDNIKSMLKTSDYDFLRDNEHLGNKIILLTLGGSHAYGTNVEGSDVDIRGCALNSKEEVLIHKDFEQITNNATDSTIYSFNKLINLLTNVNPNVIELLGNKPEHYLYLSPIGQELLNNKNLFLSQRAAYTFGGYATAQLRRLDNKAARLTDQSTQEAHVLKSIQNATIEFKKRYFDYDDDSIKLYIDTAVNDYMDSEIFMDINLHHYPLRDYKCMWSDMNTIVKDYTKIGHRNANAIEKGKLSKHMTHLIRLYMMCLDILERSEIITYREAEHNLLMDIRNGKYLDENRQPIPEFFEMVDEYEKRFDYAKEHTDLPDAPNYKKINEFVMSVNERIVKDDI